MDDQDQVDIGDDINEREMRPPIGPEIVAALRGNWSSWHDAAQRTHAADLIERLVDVIRLCRPYIMTDEHSEEADCDCDYMMDLVLREFDVKRSDG